jgi:2-polyprenyl-3-methyl-5-hydroxy-6-metoxy-1,4-benzoquinol methylase
MERHADEATCVVCSSHEVREWYPAEIQALEAVSFRYTFSPDHTRTFRVVRCRSCSHAFCSPIPQNVSDQYRDVVDQEYLGHSESRRLAARAVLRIIRRHAPTGILLDVGCATGDFLEVARGQGYRVEGVELSRWSSTIARERGLVVHQESLETFAATRGGRYDVVTLWGVIEHFAEPAVEMRRLRELLRPGGLLALWTGDVDSVTSRMLGRKWWYWQGQHIQYFTHASLKRLVGASSLEHVKTYVYPFAATSQTLANSLRRYRWQSVMNALLAPLFVLRPVWYLRLPGELLFLARRPTGVRCPAATAEATGA